MYHTLYQHILLAVSTAGCELSCVVNVLVVGCSECPEKTVGLVIYPKTSIDEEAGSVTTVTTRCVENAVQSSDSLDVTCSSAGVWGSEQPQCRCIDNYIHNNTGTCTGKKVYLEKESVY